MVRQRTQHKYENMLSCKQKITSDNFDMFKNIRNIFNTLLHFNPTRITSSCLSPHFTEALFIPSLHHPNINLAPSLTAPSSAIDITYDCLSPHHTRPPPPTNIITLQQQQLIYFLYYVLQQKQLICFFINVAAAAAYRFYYY